MRRHGILAVLLAMSLLAGCDKPNYPIAPHNWKTVGWDGESARFLLDGRPASVVRSWDFAQSGQAQGFVPSNAAMTAQGGQGLVIVNGADPGLRSPPGLGIKGDDAAILLVRLTRRTPTKVWDGAVFYTTPRHGESEAFVNRLAAAPEAGVPVVLAYPMTYTRSGRSDWGRGKIEQIRLDLEADGGETVVHQIALVREPG